MKIHEKKITDKNISIWETSTYERSGIYLVDDEIHGTVNGRDYLLVNMAENMVIYLGKESSCGFLKEDNHINTGYEEFALKVIAIATNSDKIDKL